MQKSLTCTIVILSEAIPTLPNLSVPIPNARGSRIQKIIHHLEAMPVDSPKIKRSKAYHWIWFNLRNFSSKIWKLIRLFQVNFWSLRFQGRIYPEGDVQVVNVNEFHARVWQVVLIHLLRAGESKMPTHQILMGSPNPKKWRIQWFSPNST